MYRESKTWCQKKKWDGNPVILEEAMYCSKKFLTWEILSQWFIVHQWGMIAEIYEKTWQCQKDKILHKIYAPGQNLANASPSSIAMQRAEFSKKVWNLQEVPQSFKSNSGVS